MDIGPAIGLALVVIVVGLLIWRKVGPSRHHPDEDPEAGGASGGARSGGIYLEGSGSSGSGD
ncbi:MAG: hypothetical protein AAF557_09550 [Pseudomonadota bacterium]